MTMTFPLVPGEFWARLPIATMSLDADTPVEFSRTAAGRAWTSDLGDPLYVGKVTLGRMTEAERRDVEVLLDILRPAARPFYAYDSRGRWPKADPRGRILGTAAPIIASIPSARELTLSGLPARYLLSRGDYLAFDLSGGRRALHHVVDAVVTASSAGVTPAFEVFPPLQASAAPGAAVTLVDAACKAILKPGGVTKGTSRHTITEGATFEFIQTLS